MAKKKKKKDKNNNKFEYSNEIVGVIIILLGVIGILGTGIIGNMIKSFSIFLVGTVYLGLLIFLVITGLLLIFKKEKPNLFSSKLIGVYTTIISILVMLHVKYIEINGTEGVKIITETFNNLMLSFSNDNALSNSGGGIIGAIFSYIFVTFFGDGTMIVIATLLVLGIILIFNVSILGLINKIKPAITRVFERTEYEDEEDDETEDIHVSDSSEYKEAIETPAIEVEPPKKEIIDDDVPIIRAPLKINKEESMDVEDEVVINSVNENYQLPPINLLNTIKNVSNRDNEIKAKSNIAELEKVLKDFDITGRIVQVNIGPTVTQYELEIKAGTKVSKLLSIQREIALALAAKDVRIQAPIPGKSTIGIELPNQITSSVSFKEVLNRMPEVNDKN